MYDIAVFEEKQFNPDHAKVLYNDIMKNYPDTDSAEMAKKALNRLNGGGPDKRQ